MGGARWCIPYNTIRIFLNLTQTAPFILVSDYSSYFLHWPSFVRVPKEYSIACLQKDPSTRQANVLHMSMHSLLYSPRILQNVFDFTLSFHSTTTPVPTHVDQLEHRSFYPMHRPPYPHNQSSSSAHCAQRDAHHDSHQRQRSHQPPPPPPPPPNASHHQQRRNDDRFNLEQSLLSFIDDKVVQKDADLHQRLKTLQKHCATLQRSGTKEQFAKTNEDIKRCLYRCAHGLIRLLQTTIRNNEKSERVRFESTIRDLQHTSKTHTETIAQHLNTIRTLNHKVKTLSNQSSSSSEETQALIDKCFEQHRELRTVRSERDAARRSMESLQTCLDHKTVVSKSQLNEMGKLRQENHKKTKQLRDVEKQYLEVCQEKEQAKEDVMQWEQKCKTLQDECDALKVPPPPPTPPPPVSPSLSPPASPPPPTISPPPAAITQTAPTQIAPAQLLPPAHHLLQSSRPTSHRPLQRPKRITRRVQDEIAHLAMLFGESDPAQVQRYKTQLMALHRSTPRVSLKIRRCLKEANGANGAVQVDVCRQMFHRLLTKQEMASSSRSVRPFPYQRPLQRPVPTNQSALGAPTIAPHPTNRVAQMLS